jgi:hypothetical protein
MAIGMCGDRTGSGRLVNPLFEVGPRRKESHLHPASSAQVSTAPDFAGVLSAGGGPCGGARDPGQDADQEAGVEARRVCMANCKSLSVSWISRGEPFRLISVPRASRSQATPARNEPVSHGEVDRRGDDDPQSVPFSCRLEDATGGNKQQLEATSGNSQHSEAKAFKQQVATGSNSRQHAATRAKPGC